MFAYNPEKFASLYETELGQRIWAFLTEAENVARLETASQLGKPAVEGIEEHYEIVWFAEPEPYGVSTIDD